MGEPFAVPKIKSRADIPEPSGAPVKTMRRSSRESPLWPAEQAHAQELGKSPRYKWGVCSSKLRIWGSGVRISSGAPT